jgi:osmotically-inducible protein OsmY/sporulation protein YlmC with PRC-barrel domain
MRNRKLITVLVTGGLALAAANLTAQRAEEALPKPGEPQLSQETQNPKEAQPNAALAAGGNLKASSIIGLHVRNDTGERLGKLQDIIVNLESHAAPFAIVEYGGTLGIGVTRIAVPLSDLKWSSESKQLLLTATKEEFQSANPAPTGGWMVVSGEDWAKNVDRFYGQPSMIDKSRYERQEATGVLEGREPVRNPVEAKSAAELLNPTPGTVPEEKNLVTKPTDEDLMTKVTGLVRADVGQDADNIQVTIKDGVVTLKGKVASASQKQALETRIKALPGVTRIEDNLETSKD